MNKFTDGDLFAVAVPIFLAGMAIGVMLMSVLFRYGRKTFIARAERRGFGQGLRVGLDLRQAINTTTISNVDRQKERR